MQNTKPTKYLKDEQYYIDLMDTFVDMRLAGQLTEEEYKTIRTKLLKQISILKERIKKSEPGAQDWQSVAEMAFDFATHAHEIFPKGDTETKRVIVMALGNHTLKDRKLNVELNPLLRPMKIYAEHENK